MVTIVYSFISENGRNGDKFAAKLTQQGDDVTYFVNKDKKYEIKGKTEKLITNKNEISEILVRKVDIEAEHTCILTEWSILQSDKMHR